MKPLEPDQTAQYKLVICRCHFTTPYTYRKGKGRKYDKEKAGFLRDLDTAIMDELTGGGIKENAAGLVGTLTQIEKIKQLCGCRFVVMWQSWKR